MLLNVGVLESWGHGGTLLRMGDQGRLCEEMALSSACRLRRASLGGSSKRGGLGLDRCAWALEGQEERS